MVVLFYILRKNIYIRMYIFNAFLREKLILETAIDYSLIAQGVVNYLPLACSLLKEYSEKFQNDLTYFRWIAFRSVT